ncbi:hypothetical protein, partial [Nonomuraea aridisoli]
MRTWFGPEEQDDFEAAKALLVRRCLAWAQQHDRPADGLLLEAALDARHESRDGRLAYWDEPQIRRFLLNWIPAQLVAEREVLDTAPEVLRTYLHYLATTGLLDPRGATLAAAEEAIDRAAADYPQALDDPARQGLAKFWVQVALSHGVDITDQDAFEQFRRDIDAGVIQYDHDVLNDIMEARLLGRDAVEERAFPQPPIALPPQSELTEAAARSETVRRLAALTKWVGPDGRSLTKTGNLSLADAREVAALLGTGEENRQARTSTELHHVTLLLTWAKKLHLIRTSKGRLLQVAKAGPLLRDPFELWRRAFTVFPDLGRWVCTSESPLAGSFPETLPDLLNSMYGLDAMPVARLEETVWLACRDYFLDGFLLSDDESGREWVAHDLGRTFEILSDLGAVELTHGPADPLYTSDLDHEEQELPPDAVERLRARLSAPDLLLARLTPLALSAVRDSLLAEGRDAPLIGELATASPASLLGVISEHYSHDGAVAELDGWLAHPGHNIDALLQAVRACPFRSRASALLHVLGETLPEIRARLPRLRDDPALGPIVLSHLVDRGDLAPASLPPHEHLLLAAESFITLLEIAGLETLEQQLKAKAGPDAPGFLEAVLSSGHPDTVGLEEIRTLVALALI